MSYEIHKINPSEASGLIKEIPDAPSSLYYRGNLPNKDTKVLAVVGSRAYSDYGKRVCEELISGLAGYNISIVSGLALGLDAIAHRAALKAGLHTLAIPGSGLSDSVLYPRTNVPLAKEILKSGGGLLSEFEPDEKTRMYFFPKRNRIMAGISHATLIVEAEEKSGTLITARLAMEYNRDVMTIPHSIYSSKSKGPHHLLKNGAALIESPDDILETLNIEPRDTRKEEPKNLSQHESLIMKTLESPLEKDALISNLNLPPSDVDVTLSTLELKGLIERRMGTISKVK